MEIILRIYKWLLFEFKLMSPSKYDDLDFTYFGFGILFFYLCIEKYYGRISFIFQIGRGADWDVLIDYEKILKEDKE